MSRRLLGVVCAVAMAAALSLAPAASAQSGGGCQLDGTASFSPGLGTAAQDFTYAFGGALTSCQSSTSGAPASGSVSAGNVYTDPITGQKFQEPRSSGNGSCSNSTTSGTSIVTWADGTRTIVKYDTTGAAAAVHLSGTVIATITLPAINPAPGQPTSTTLSTTRYAGSSSLGVLAFEADPQACASPGGVTSAGIAGVIGLGSS
jgi:hypothetical protein